MRDAVVDADTELIELSPAEAAGLIRIDTVRRRVEFTHPLVRAVVVDLASTLERRAAHLTLAERVAADSDTRAWHLAEASLGPDEPVAALIEQSAYRVLQRGDAVAAVAALVRAAYLSPTGPARGRRLAQAAFVGADVAGDLSNASPLLLAARREIPALETSLSMAAAAAYLLLNGDGDVDTAHRLLTGALEAAHDSPATDRAYEEVLHTLMLVCHFGGGGELWAPFDAAMQRVGQDLSPVLTVSAVTYADPVGADAIALLDARRSSAAWALGG